MRVKTRQASSKYLGTLIFFLLLFLNEVFPSAAFAFTSLNTCARSKECLELIRGSSSSAVSAPTGAGYGVTTLRTTTSSGVIKTFVNGVADFAIVAGPSAAYVSWHYWDEAHNGRAQERAKQRYCAAYPTDVVCVPFTGGQSPGVSYWAVATGVSSWNCQMLQNAYGFQLEYCDDSSGYGSYYDLAHRLGGGIRDLKGPAQFLGFRQALDQFNQGCWFMDVRSSDGYRSERQVCHYGPWFPPPGKMKFAGMLRMDGQPDTGGNPPPLLWKDWPQAKRDRAVALLNDADWQRLITSMPVGGTLDPGDSVKAPKIGIPGQEWDNPNTPLDDRRFKSILEEYPRPTFPDLDHDSDPDETDVDDDNDGFLDPYDAEPRIHTCQGQVTIHLPHQKMIELINRTVKEP